MATLALGPIGSIPAVAQGSTTVSGTATDTNGNPLAGVTVTLTGPQTYTATTDGDGKYTIENVAPGDYSAVAAKGGYGTERDTTFSVTGGQDNALNVSLQQATLTTLREIGRTSTRSGRAGFNTTAASVNIISRQTFIDQGFQQVARVLDQTPGIVSGHPGTSANNAAPGAITFPNIRGGLSFETATLIDGHSLSVGAFGDYVTTFLNSYVLQDVELIKGPGAAAPEVNYAINGTVNFRTLDVPTGTPRGSVTVGADNWGGVFSNFNAGGTVFNGKLGFVFDYAVDGTPGPLQNTLGNVTFGATGGNPTINGVSQNPSNFTTNAIVNPVVQNNPFFATASIFASGFPVNTTYNSKTELAKLKFNFSDATSVTVSYLGSQTYTDQNGNHVYQFPTQFTPGAGYTGPTVANSIVPTYQNVFFPPNEWEINNEPIFQGEFRTHVFKNDNLLARYYAASINRLQYNALSSPTQAYSTTMNLTGTFCPAPSTLATGANAGKCQTGTGGGATFSNPTQFNNTPATLAFPGCLPTAAGGFSTSNNCQFFRAAEEDKLHGGSFEYDHLFGDSGNVVSLAFDQTASTTYAYDYSGSGNVPTVPAGSTQVNSTALLRGIFNIGPKLNLTESNYFNLYNYHFGNALTPGSAFITYSGQAYGHFDERLGLVYRPNTSLAVRGSVGSAIAPPYLQLLSRSNTAPAFSPVCNCWTNSAAPLSPIRPETSFGYDLGADWRLGSGIDVFSADLYLNNVFNQFVTATTQQAACTSGAGGVGGCTLVPIGTPGALPLLSSTNMNLGNARYMGAEFVYKHDPAIGIGGLFQGALIRAYPYNITSSFYCSNPAICPTPNTNLAVVNGANYLTNGTSGSPGTFNALSNQSIPYAQGYAEVHMRTLKGGLGLLGVTYYGNNNSYNVPAFFVVNGAVRFPIVSSKTMIQLSVDNVLSILPNPFISPFLGVADNLVNNKLGLTNANTVGPTTIKLSLTQAVGGR